MSHDGEYDPFEANEEAHREARRRTYERGIGYARRILADRNVPPPADELHADAYDPPLAVVEQRHWVHERFGMEIDGCRFCDQDGELHRHASRGTMEPA